MKLPTPFNSDDRAVSPVIGVILMVAITVILAAVIGTFVLGLGDSLGDNQPSAQLSASLTEVDSNNATLTIDHNGGDSIESGSVDVVVTGVNDDARADGTIDTRLSVGDSVSTELGAGDGSNPDEIRVRLIHTPSDSILLDRTFEVDDLEMGDDDSLNFDL